MQPLQLAVELLEVGVRAGKGHELGGAHRREIGRVGEEHQPLAGVVAELADAVGGTGLE
jgi:hypothetical protein